MIQLMENVLAALEVQVVSMSKEIVFGASKCYIHLLREWVNEHLEKHWTVTRTWRDGDVYYAAMEYGDASYGENNR